MEQFDENADVRKILNLGRVGGKWKAFCATAKVGNEWSNLDKKQATCLWSALYTYGFSVKRLMQADGQFSVIINGPRKQRRRRRFHRMDTVEEDTTPTKLKPASAKSQLASINGKHIITILMEVHDSVMEEIIESTAARLADQMRRGNIKPDEN